MNKEKETLPEWHKEGINYWENEDCPKEYLEKAMVGLVDFVEGEEVPIIVFQSTNEAELRNLVGFYEYLSDK